jgi:hypothetical protein
MHAATFLFFFSAAALELLSKGNSRVLKEKKVPAEKGPPF